MLNLKGVVKPNRLSEPGLLFFFLICAYPTPSELKPWAWQPSLTTFIYEATRMCYIPHLPAAHFSTCDYAALWMSLLGTLCRPALARGCCQRNAIEGVCCLSPQLSEMCSITTYSHQVLNSPPSLILHRCSRRKLFFFFFFALNLGEQRFHPENSTCTSVPSHEFKFTRIAARSRKPVLLHVGVRWGGLYETLGFFFSFSLYIFLWLVLVVSRYIGI